MTRDRMFNIPSNTNLITELYTIVTDIKYLLFGYCLHAVLTKKYTKHILVPTYKTFFWNLRIFMPSISLTILTMPYSVQNLKLCKQWSSQKHILIQTKIQIACARANDKKCLPCLFTETPFHVYYVPRTHAKWFLFNFRPKYLIFHLTNCWKFSISLVTFWYPFVTNLKFRTRL